MDRRTAVATLAGILAASARRPEEEPLEPQIPPPPIGIQLYTLRTLLASAFDATLAAVAAIGYREVEFAGYFNRTGAQIGEALARAGLAAPSAHFDHALLRDGWSRAVESAAAAGHRYIVIAWIPPGFRRTMDDWRRLAQQLNQAAAVAQDMGLGLAYHNHDYEFEPLDGTLPYSVLLDQTDPGSVLLQMDLYWCSKAGQRPEDWFARASGRYRMVHVKDMDAQKNMVDPGTGILDFPTLLRAAGRAGTQHWFVEHDMPPDPLATARAGYKYLSGLSI